MSDENTLPEGKKFFKEYKLYFNRVMDDCHGEN